MTDLVERVAKRIRWFSGFSDVKDEAHAIINDVLEEAAKVAKTTMVMCEIQKPGTGPFTRQDCAINEAREQIAAAIRALGEGDD